MSAASSASRGAWPGLGVFVGVALLAALPARFRAALGVGFVLLWFYVLTGTLTERGVPTLLTGVSSGLVGGAGAFLLRRGPGAGARLRVAVAAAATVAGVGAGGVGVLWLIGEGYDDPPTVDAAAATKVSVPALDLPDPSAPGPARVLRTFYGSGTSARLPDYGPGVPLRTRPVDGARLLRGWGGFDGWARARYWGFDAHALPIDGRVFYPEGDGPFPVVMIVHGGHAMGEASEPGYDYLGEHLASHGYVFVSVEENFLNAAAWVDYAGGLGGENAARGWLLLEHLRALRGFDAGEGPLHGKLDLDRVAVAGHSKGGEAAELAALFNRLPCLPDDASVRFDYGFGIRAVIALATTDRQYQPAGAPPALSGVDFLALQGSNDGDVETFQGAQQYERVDVRGPAFHFKEAVYVHRANHGQWNRVWGRSDKSRFPRRAFFNRRPILAEADQERVARAYLTAFLAVSLRGERGYLPFLRDHRAGRAWLPDTILLDRFEDSDTQYVARFDEDVDLSTTTIPGGHLRGEGLSSWREQPAGPSSLWSTLDGRSVYVGWDAASARKRPSYTLELPPVTMEAPPGAAPSSAPKPPGLDPRGLAPGASLVFALADARGAHEPIDLTVAVADAAGHTARIALDEVRLLQPQIETRVWKRGLRMEPRHEIVFQTFSIPLTRFVERAPDLQLATLRAVRFLFDKTPAGTVVLDDIGFARPPP